MIVIRYGNVVLARFENTEEGRDALFAWCMNLEVTVVVEVEMD